MLWYGTGLHPVWWLTWIAPLPLLFVAARVRWIPAFFIAFATWAIGGLNGWSYLHGLIGAPLGVALLADLAPALVFALAVMVWRVFVRRSALVRAVLGFAAIWVSFEFCLQKISVHSTWGNLAYSQMNCLPVLQVASLAGVAGISFLLFFIPGAVAAIVSGTAARRTRLTLAGCTVALVLFVIGWGGLRVREPLTGPEVTVGLIASDVPVNLRPRDPDRIQKTFTEYGAQAKALIREGARLVVLPEKNAIISGSAIDTVDRILNAAAMAGATVATGVERWTPAAKLNEIRMYGPDGQLQATYEKHHMLPAFESNLLPGTSRTILHEPSGAWGVEICKDMDFPALSRQYGRDGVGLLIVPAWDFNADGWYHGRMAIMRGVESGFSIARAPKQGVLTISDDRGRVLAERQTSTAEFATLLSRVPVHHDDTLYDLWGDWFGWLNVVAMAGLILNIFLPQRYRLTRAAQHERNPQSVLTQTR